MNENHRELLSMGLTVAIVLLTLYVSHRFVPSFVWAAIIAVSTYPLYRRCRKWLGDRDDLSAFLFTLILSFVVIAPLSWLVTVLVKEAQLFINYLQTIHHEGGQAPSFVHQIPWFGADLESLLG
jgi:predicted PurR-regulated permease PerM